MSDQTEQQPARPTSEQSIEHAVMIESLTFLYRSMPSAAVGHTVAGGLITLALYEQVDSTTLFIWLGCVITVAIVRLAITKFVERRLIDAESEAIKTWSNLLAALALVQTSIWGASVFLIWPDDLAYRAVLVAILAGIIAAGGIMLTLHRKSFMIYCLPITIPAVIQLAMGGSKLEWILAALLIFYSALLLVSVNRLTNVFLEGIRIRLLMQNESRTDALTALSNRRGFDESLHDMWQQAMRSKQSIGLLVIDVDFFKN